MFDAMRDRFWPVVCLAVWVAFSVPAPAVDPAWSLTEYAHKAWRFREADLPGRPVSLTQTRDGFIWVGTHNGLLRFDGLRFLPWSGDGRTALPSSTIFSLVGAQDGSLWIGSERGMSHLRKGRLSNFLEDSEADVARVGEDDEGAIWLWRLGTRGKEPLCFIAAEQPRCFGVEAGIEPQTASSVLPDHEGNVWIGTSTGVLRWQRGKLRTYPIPGLQHHTSVPGVTALAWDVDGSLLVGVDATGPGLGLQRLGGQGFATVHAGGLDGSTLDVLSLLVDRRGVTWVGTTDGLYRLRPHREAEHFSAADGLSGHQVTHLYEDRDGSIWTVTDGGVDNFHDVAVVSLGNAPEFPSTEVDGVLRTRDGSLWVGGWQTLYRRRPGEHEFTSPAGALQSKQVAALFEDSSGRMWVGIEDSLNTLEDGRLRPVSTASGQPIGMIKSMTEDSEHRLWVVSLGPPRKVFQVDRISHVATEVPGLPPASKVTHDPHEGFWLGLVSGELAHYGRDGLRRVHIPHEGIESRIKQLVTSPDGAILAATDYGLAVLRDEQIAVLSTRNGLPCSEVFASVLDASGNLWLYMECGLVEVSKADFSRWWLHPDTTVRTLRLDSSDGVQGQLTPFDAATRTGDGRLWFANNSVLQTFDPATVSRPGAPTPAVYIDAVIADYTRYKADSPLTIPPLTRDIQFDYTTPNFIFPAKVRFRYRLKGFDKTWIDSGTRRATLYTHLPPGEYQFQVIAANPRGAWSSTPATVRFRVLPAVYQTLWFKLLLGVALIALVSWLGSLRLRRAQERIRQRMEARSAERERIARDLHDTLLQGIQALWFRLQTWASDPAIPERQQREIETVAAQTHSIMAAGREKILELRQTSPRASELAETLIAFASAYANGGPKLEVDIQGRLRPLTVDAYEQLSSIGCEALRNAYQHSGAAIIALSLRYARRALTMTVSDAGCGFASIAEKEPGHYGLVGMRERADLIGAELSVDSAPGRGTTVKVVVSRERVYDD